MISISVFLLGSGCKATDASSINTQPKVAPEAVLADQNLKGIVDLSSALDECIPSTFAAASLKDYFEAMNKAVEIPDKAPGLQNETVKSLRERDCQNGSKTSIFQKSFLGYIKIRYNQRNYAYQLAQDGTDVVQFVSLSKEINLDPDADYVGMRLFYNKFKAAELVDDTVILKLLKETSGGFRRHFVPVQQPVVTDVAVIKKQLETMLLNKFAEHLTAFQQKPDAFLSELADEIARYQHQEMSRLAGIHPKVEAAERLRGIVIRLYDTVLGKVIWNPYKPELIWKSFTEIAKSLELLANDYIVVHMDDLDDLLWTLTHRFCFFLDLYGASLPTTFYQEAEHDLTSKTVFFLEYKEQDEGIASKKDTLLDFILRAKARAVAYEKKGIISTPMFQS